MAHDLFISYSTQDKTTADAACATLEAAGIRCWIAPRDISPGAEWGEAIVAAIGDSRAMLLIFSASANDSPQIRREVERAVSKAIPVIPLRIEDIVPTRSLEYFIGTVHWLDALTPPLEGHLRRLTETVKALLQVPGAKPEVAAPASVAVAAAAAHARRAVPIWLIAVMALLIGLGGAAAGWWLFAPKAPAPQLAQAPAPGSVAVGTPNPTPAPQGKTAAAPAPATTAPAPSAAMPPSVPPAAPEKAAAKPAETAAPAAAKIAETAAPAASAAKTAAAVSSPPPAAKLAESGIGTTAAPEKPTPPPLPTAAAPPSAPPAAKPAESSMSAAEIEKALAPPPKPPAAVPSAAPAAKPAASSTAAPKPAPPALVAALPADRAPATRGKPATRRFDNPMIEGTALDYCRIWAHECGKPAADAFCRLQGFAAAVAFTPRSHAPPTRVIDTGQVCSGEYCTRISDVTCGDSAAVASLAHAPAGSGKPAMRRFDDPMVEGIPLAYCRTLGQNCGKPAADAFCQSQGFAEASQFAPRFHAPPSRAIDNGQVCNGDNCARMVSIVCTSGGGGGEQKPAGPRQATLEYGVNRSGFDMRNLTLRGGTPEQCRDACLAEPSCRAFTFVQAGIQGPDARCWLKHEVPQATPAKCCVSGVVD